MEGQQNLNSSVAPGNMNVSNNSEQTQNMNRAPVSSNAPLAPAQGGAHPNPYMQQMFSNPAAIAQFGYPSQVLYQNHPLVGIPNMIAPGPTPSVSSESTSNGTGNIHQNSSAQTPNSSSAFNIPAMAGVMGVAAVAGGFEANTQQHPHSKNTITQIGGKIKQKKIAASKSISSSLTKSSGTKKAHPALATASIPSQSMDNSTSTTLGGVPIPPLPPNSTTAMQVQVAAAAAAAAAAPPKGYHGPKSGSKRDNDTLKADGSADSTTTGGKRGTKRSTNNPDLTPEEKQKLNRDRNREHARSTRLRKKAYVNKLKELVDGLHAERSEEARKRRVAVQHLAEVQSVRKTVINTFLQYHAGYESDPRKWITILEDDFFLKQPVTPYRSFRRVEIEQGRERECRKSRGINAIVGDAASMSVMVESIGSRSARWMQIKREDFLRRHGSKTGSIRRHMPHSIVRQSMRQQHAVSSLSSSSGSSTGNGSGEEEEKQQAGRQQQTPLSQGKSGTPDKVKKHTSINPSAKKVSSASSGSGSSTSNQARPSNDFHDYHAQPLPDPMLDSGNSSTGSDSPTDSQNGSDIAVVGKHICTDCSSGDEEKPPRIRSKKRRLSSLPPTLDIPSSKDGSLCPDGVSSATSQREDDMKIQNRIIDNVVPLSVPSSHGGDSSLPDILKPAAKRSGLPTNIARSGGISHNIRPLVGAGAINKDLNSRLSTAPAIPLPPFVGIGKRASTGVDVTTAGTPLVNSSSSSEIGIDSNGPKTSGLLHVAPAVIPSRDSASSSKGGGGSNGSGVSSGSANATNLIAADNDTSSTESSIAQIQAYYHVNEDDMLITEDVLMCPFIFRSQDAVLCGALAECVMPGMLRAQFSSQNKLMNLEMVYDAMGFMQQLERASGSEGAAQIVPNSLEMALQPKTDEARAITMSKPPFKIVSVNKTWTRITKYSQMEVEGKEIAILNGKLTDDVSKRPRKPPHDLNMVAKGHAACSVNIQYNKYGKDLICFISSFPLTNSNDEVTHLLHTIKELPEPTTIEFADAQSNSVSFQDQ